MNLWKQVPDKSLSDEIDVQGKHAASDMRLKPTAQNPHQQTGALMTCVHDRNCVAVRARTTRVLTRDQERMKVFIQCSDVLTSV